jgi:hypothetical protein
MLSTPLLVGYFVPGLAIVALATPALAANDGGRIWPTASRTRLAGTGLAALALAWLLPLSLAVGSVSLRGVVNFEGLADNLIPLCGFDAPFPLYGLVPAVIGSGVYLGLAWLSVTKGKPWLWLVASLA